MGVNRINVISNQQFKSMGDAEKILFSALQGLTANQKRGIWCIADNINDIAFTPMANELWLQQSGLKPVAVDDPWDLLQQYPNIKKYVLYDLNSNPDSANIASSLAGPLQALPVDTSIQSKANNHGLKQLKDVSKLTYGDFFTEYKDKLSQDLAVELNDEFSQNMAVSWGPRDYAAAQHAAVLFGSQQRDQVMKTFANASPVYGWGPVEGSEFNFIQDVSQSGNYYVAADHAQNLSILSQLKVAPKSLPAAPAPAIKLKSDTTYVCFIMSDGDNLQWLLNRGNYQGWWGSPYRGKIPMGWTISPSLYYLAPVVWNYYLDTMLDTDEMLCGPSGIGYVFNSIKSNINRFREFTHKTEAFLKSSGLNLMTLFGNQYPDQIYLDGVTKNEQILGAFYFSFQPWVVPYGTNIQLFNKVPVIPAVQDLSGNATEVASNIINNTCQTSFYTVYVNAWGNNNQPMETVNEVYQQLMQHSNISVVKPGELVHLVNQLLNNQPLNNQPLNNQTQPVKQENPMSITEHLVYTTNQVGGDGGSYFTFCDQNALTSLTVTGITNNSNVYICEIKVTDGSGTTKTYGTNPGSSYYPVTKTLDLSNDRIKSISLFNSTYDGGRLGGIAIDTVYGLQFRNGDYSGTPIILSIDDVSDFSSFKSVGIFGRAGADINKLGFFLAKDLFITAEVGGTGGTPYVYTEALSIDKFQATSIENGGYKYVSQIQMTNEDGTITTYGTNPGSIYNPTTVSLDLTQDTMKNVTLFKSDYSTGRLGGIYILTSNGKTVTIGDTTGTGTNLEVNGSTDLSRLSFSGAYGHSGADIDSLGMFFTD